MNRRTFSFVGVALWVAVAPAAAQPSAPAQTEPPLSLRQAIDEALASNPDVHAARAAAAAADLRPALDRDLAPPVVTGQVFSWPFDTANPANAQMMVTIEQMFPGRGKRDLRVAAAQRDADVARGRIDVEALRIATEVKTAYVDLLLARRVAELLEQSATLADQLSAATEIRYGTGRVSQQDVVKAMVERTRIEMERAEARERARLAEATLNALRGLAPMAPIGPLEDSPDPPVPPAEALVEQVHRHHPEFAVRALEAAAATAAATAAEAARKPDWVVSGGYMQMPNETDAWTASVGITWPNAPWSRKHVDATRLEAEGRRDAARAMQASVENMLVREVHHAAVRVGAVDERLAILESALVPQAEHALELARLNYQSDRGEFLDIVDAMRLTMNLARESAGLRASRRLAVVDLERALGADVAPDGTLVQRQP